MRAKEVRYEAREAMSGKWGRFVGMHLLLTIITFLALIVAMAPMYIGIISTLTKMIVSGTNDASAALGMIGSFGISYVLLIISMLFIVPLSYAFLENMVKLKRDNNTKCTEFLGKVFKKFGRAWKVGLWCMVKLLVIYLIFIGSFFLISILIGIFTALNLEIVAGILGIIMFVGVFAFEILFIARALSLTLAQYVAIDNSEFTAKQSVEKSIELMKGYRWKFICLNLSFIGWIILSCLTFGMGFVFLYPYMQVSYICFYENVAKEKGQPVLE